MAGLIQGDSLKPERRRKKRLLLLLTVSSCIRVACFLVQMDYDLVVIVMDGLTPPSSHHQSREFVSCADSLVIGFGLTSSDVYTQLYL